ncbi:HNH endonuclease [Actinosynnema sp. NPDC047251]|uniref:HNH endonuclease n=1 Tax=Saccharothrix espanaensis TaxID=103731 RepID=UPI0011DD2BEC|nr:HNH endonuclease [Saccharothrix espanaensis]
MYIPACEVAVDQRSYTTGTEKALFMLSRGRCYAPECPAKVIRNVETGPEVNVEIAHIVAHKENGPRYDENVGDEERRSFTNLILLCPPHHKMVDRKGNENIYTVELLRKWKVDREGDYASELEGLDNLTQDKLESILTDTVQEVKGETLAAIERLEGISGEAAQTLRVLVAEVFDRPYLDVDAIALLNESALMLRHLEDSASMLNGAARRLGGLEDSASTLLAASHRLVNLEDSASTLSSAADRLRGLEDNSSSLRFAAREMQSAVETMPSHYDLSSVVENLRLLSGGFSRAVDSADSVLRNVVTEIENSRDVAPRVVYHAPKTSDIFWKGVGVGVFLSCLLCVIAIVVWRINNP